MLDLSARSAPPGRDRRGTIEILSVAQAGDEAGQGDGQLLPSLVDDRGRVYPLVEVRNGPGWSEARTRGPSAVFRGPVAHGATVVRLTVGAVRVGEEGKARLRLPLDRLAPGRRLPLGTRLHVGRWPVVVESVTRAAPGRFLFDVDLGGERDGARLLNLYLHPVAAPGEERGASSLGASFDNETGQVDVFELTYTPSGRFLELEWVSPQVRVRGPWTVEIPLR